MPVICEFVIKLGLWNIDEDELFFVRIYLKIIDKTDYKKIYLKKSTRLSSIENSC